jgi:hypothetical protein
MSPRDPVARWLAFTGLILLGVVLLAAPVAVRHGHDGPGLYNPDCPLVALLTADRQGSVTVTAASVPLLVATALSAVATAGNPALAFAAGGVRFRAPPAR